jgi:serine/threonine protein kinase
VPEGALIGNRWRVIGQLGEGGFGRVFEAVDESDISLGRGAVKLLHPNISPQERNAFLGEVKKIAGLRHPNLVGYLDSGQQTVGGELHPYVVTELCVGSLSDNQANRAGGFLDAGETLTVLADVAAGLDHLHSRSMIHRDIKPGNVLYAEGNWKLADFGLMRDLTATGTYHRSSQLVGTPLFMAPELFSTMTATAPSDVYALGVLAHMVSTGRPLHAGTGAALVHQITNSPPEIDPNLHPAVRDLIARSTDLDPVRRISAKQFHEQAAAAKAEAVASTRALSGFPPPTAPATGTTQPPAGHVPASTGAPAVSEPTVAAVSAGVSSPPANHSSPYPPPGDPSGPYPPPVGSSSHTATAEGGPTPVATSPQGYRAPVGAPGPRPSTPEPKERNALIPALAVVSLVALAAIAGLAFVLLRDSGSDTAGTGIDDSPSTTAGTVGSETTADSAPTSTTGADDNTTGGDSGDSDQDPANPDAPLGAAQTGAIDVTSTAQPVMIDLGGAPVDGDLSTPALLDGSIDVALDQRTFNFQGAAGQFVSGEITQMNGICDFSERWDFEALVTDASGNPIGESFDNPSCADTFGPWELPTDGTYSFVVLGGEGSSVRQPTGSFQVLVGIQDRVTTPLDLTDPVDITGGIVVARDQQLFPFDATAGQRVSLEIKMMNGLCEFAARWQLTAVILDAAGSQIGEEFDNLACGDALGPWELPADGRYTLILGGGDGSVTRPATGTYQVRFAKLGG